MFYRVSSLSVMAVLLLSPTLVCANEINQELDLSVGNIQIQTDSIGGVRFQTPSMYLNTIHPFAIPRQRLSHYPRRFYPSFGRGYSPSIIPYTSSVRGFATRTSWGRTCPRATSPIRESSRAMPWSGPSRTTPGG